VQPVGRDSSIGNAARRAVTKVAVTPDGCATSFLLRSPWPGLVLLPLFLLFLFLHLLLLDLFLVLLATFVSHACSFLAIMTLDGD
jgi:hypothetical protein